MSWHFVYSPKLGLVFLGLGHLLTSFMLNPSILVLCGLLRQCWTRVNSS